LVNEQRAVLGSSLIKLFSTKNDRVLAKFVKSPIACIRLWAKSKFGKDKYETGMVGNMVYVFGIDMAKGTLVVLMGGSVFCTLFVKYPPPQVIEITPLLVALIEHTQF